MKAIAKEIGDKVYGQAADQISKKMGGSSTTSTTTSKTQTESVIDKKLYEQVNRIKKLMNL
jgi:hypothetical protein